MSYNEKTVAVIGLGYVGLPLALLTAKKGYTVYGIDINTDKITFLQNRVSPFTDAKISEELKTTTLQATTDFSKVSEAGTIIICVPTPVYENHMPNLEPVEGACRNIAPYISKGQLVVLESTVNPGVSEEIMIPIFEKETGMKVGKDFYLAHCPERINPGDSKWDVSNIPRVVGSLESEGLKKAATFYRSIIDAEIKEMGSLKEAESVKVVENAFRDINIAFVNELAMSFSKLGIDVVNVINGAATKPFSFLAHYPGCGVGGHCIPVDPYYLIEYAKENGFDHKFLSLAREINNHMPKFAVDKLKEILTKKNKTLKGATVTVLGLSYKAGIDDCRESPAFEIIKELEKEGAEVKTFDPHVLAKSNVKTFEDALTGVSAVIIVTAHKEFKNLTPKDFKEKGIEIVIDGRNCLPKDEYLASGLIYKGIGR